MAGIEASAVVREVESNWIAAIALINAGLSKIDVTSASFKDAAYRWVIKQANAAGLSESEIAFRSADDGD